MAGFLTQTKEKREVVAVGGKIYNVSVVYYKTPSDSGYVVGLKFSDQFNSMDPSKLGNTNPFLLAKAVAVKAIQMITPDLDKVSIFGFYLLTDDIETRRKGGSKLKKRVYRAKAVDIHKEVKHHLPHLTQLEADGGVGWVLSKQDFKNHHDFSFFEQELAKQLRMIPC